jgi:hypothetical protein
VRPLLLLRMVVLSGCIDLLRGDVLIGE